MAGSKSSLLIDSPTMYNVYNRDDFHRKITYRYMDTPNWFAMQLINNANPLMPVPPVTARDELWPFFLF